MLRLKTYWQVWILIIFTIGLTGCSRHNGKPLQGYIEGEYTYIASGISGTLVTLNVTRGQPIQTGQLLYTLDPQPDLAAMQAAAATIGQMQAELDFDKAQLKRQKDLYAKNATDKSSLDSAQKDFDSKTKQLQQAEAALIQAKWSYQQKTIYAPVSGHVFDTFYRVGEKTAANQPVLALLDPANVYVIFYIPEGKLSTIALGQTIYFYMDGCDDEFSAKINYISDEAEYTPPIIYTADTRNKLVFKVRAALSPDLRNKLHPGQPLDIYLT